MRAYEFITEATEKLQSDVASAMAGTYVIPELLNQDPYKQYRFGVAMAGAKGSRQRQEDGVAPLDKSSVWGEQQIVSSHMDPDLEADIDYALKELGISGKKQVGTKKSEEASDVSKISPINGFKGFN